jgi:hypothetical protein
MSNLYLNLVNATESTITSHTSTNLTVSNTLSASNMTVATLNISSSINTIQPYIIVYAATAETIPNSTFYTMSSYWSGASSSNSISLSSGLFTVTYPGMYLVCTSFGYAGSTSSSFSRVSWITKNQSGVDAQRYGQVSTNGTSNDFTISTLVQMNAGDNVSLVLYQNTGGNLTGQTAYGNKFQMVKIS